MSKMNPILQIRNLTKHFVLHHQQGAEITALADIDLEICGGECVVLSGPSGAGKSSLLRCIYGNYHASHGEILLRDGPILIDIAAASDRAIIALRRRKLGYVSQFLRVVPRIATIDIVAAPAIAAGLPADQAKLRAAQMLDRLALPERMWGLPPLTFSGGEQQRVNLARGFVVDYPLLLLDEPTASLDADNRRRVAGLVSDALARGAALLGVFHDQEFAREFATRFFPMTAPRRHAA
jgi:alpha-D-ribose 1-methylphosphonate 5-triphosphate synthase subunit PhnL